MVKYFLCVVSTHKVGIWCNALYYIHIAIHTTQSLRTTSVNDLPIPGDHAVISYVLKCCSVSLYVAADGV